MIANWMPDQAIVHARASRRTARTLCRIASPAVEDAGGRPFLGAARLDGPDRPQRGLQHPAEPPDVLLRPFLCLRDPGHQHREQHVTTTTAATVVASSTRSSTAMRTSVPTSITTPLASPTTLDETASRNNTVSEVTRVTSSPTGGG